ncbi:MAG: extracellular solute-binding protein [Treponema sp.]|nr:extracellular solute-binding protein [Treponema sp.]
MKKLSRFAMAAVLAAGITASFMSCGKKETAAAPAADPNAPAKLTVWCWDPGFNIYAMKEAAKIYNREKPNVTIDIVETPWEDLQQKLIASLSANDTSSLPDIILCQDNAILKNVSSYPNAFLPLEGKVDLSQFAQFKVAFGNVNGKNYSVPFDNGVTATFLRTDIIQEAGLSVSDFKDITWERFHELGKIVKEKTGKYMISYVGNDPDFVMVALQSAGTWFFDENGKANIANNKALIEGLKVYADMVADGTCLAVPDWNAFVASVNNGQVASSIDGSWMVGIISAQEDQAGKWAITNTPRLSVSGAKNSSSQGGSSWMIMASSKNQDLAADFLNKTFAGSKELYETILPSSGAIATWLPAADSPAYEKGNPFFGGQTIYKDFLTYSNDIPRVKYGIYNYEARAEVGVAVADILKGSSVEDALAKAEKNVKFIMGE